jgi:2-polyprenyl-3-methyl-5-hydroxy-6-metoxy-1,4-benzoquinol methylase
MKAWHHDGSTEQQVIERHGPWSAMSIHLGDGRFTREQAVDFRLKRLVQTVSDMVGKPLAECRILDLACLEGHYGIEFALHGAEVVLVEIRDANLAKTAYAIQELGLKDRCRLYQDDVRNLDPATYGQFDAIICSGILYHLRAIDASKLIASMAACSKRLCIVDTQVAARADAFVQVGKRSVGGFVYREHDESASLADKARDLWASIDNEDSFWFTPNELVTQFFDAGFTSAAEVELPTQPDNSYDRRMYVAIKGRPTKVLSSPMTAAIVHEPAPLEDPQNLHPYQRDHGLAYTIGKKVLPQQVKNSIKPTLRKLGVLKTQEAPFEDSKN